MRYYPVPPPARHLPSSRQGGSRALARQLGNVFFQELQQLLGGKSLGEFYIKRHWQSFIPILYTIRKNNDLLVGCGPHPEEHAQISTTAIPQSAA